MPHYFEADPIDPDGTHIIPHFAIEIEVSDDDWGTSISKTARLDFVTICIAGEAQGVNLTAAQAELIWGAKTIEEWEAAAADRFDADEALADEAHGLADFRYETWRDEKDDAA